MTNDNSQTKVTYIILQWLLGSLFALLIVLAGLWGKSIERKFDDLNSNIDKMNTSLQQIVANQNEVQRKLDILEYRVQQIENH